MQFSKGLQVFLRVAVFSGLRLHILSCALAAQRQRLSESDFRMGIESLGIPKPDMRPFESTLKHPEQIEM